MALMDVFVLPSWREGLPRSAIEAAASGLPLVLTDIRGCREVVRDGVEGFLVPVRDPAPAGRRDRAAPAGARPPSARWARPLAPGPRSGSTSGASRPPWSVRRGRSSAPPGGCRSRTTSRRPGPPSADGRCDDDGAAAPRVDADRVPADVRPGVPAPAVSRDDRGPRRDGARRRGSAVAWWASRPPSRRSARSTAGSPSVEASRRGSPPRRISRPSVVRRAIETARYPSSVRGPPGGGAALDRRGRREPLERRGERARGRAIAERLAVAGVREFKVVVGADNDDANRFYERNGFALAGSTTVHDGEPSNVWVKTCPS